MYIIIYIIYINFEPRTCACTLHAWLPWQQFTDFCSSYVHLPVNSDHSPQDGNSTSLMRYVFSSSLLHLKAVQPTQPLTFLSWWQIEVMFRRLSARFCRLFVSGCELPAFDPQKSSTLERQCVWALQQKKHIHLYIIYYMHASYMDYMDACLFPTTASAGNVCSTSVNPISVKESNSNIHTSMSTVYIRYSVR